MADIRHSDHVWLCINIYRYIDNSHTDEQLLKNPLEEEHLKEGASAAGSQ